MNNLGKIILMTTSDHTTLASLFAVALGLIKLLEVVIIWAFKKMSKEEKDTPVVKLDPETSRILSDMNINIENNQITIEKHNEREELVVQNVKDIAVALKDVSHTFERLETKITNNFDRLEDKMDGNWQKSVRR